MIHNRFAFLLVALVLLFVAAPLVRAFGPGTRPFVAQAVVTVVFTAMLLSAVFAVSKTRRMVIVAVSLAVPAIVVQLLDLLVQHNGILIAEHVLSIVFLGFTIVVILTSLFGNERVSLDLICASLCVYLILGILWAEVFSLLAILDPASFTFTHAAQAEAQSMRLGDERSVFPLYYSLVTMSTLGYGDIVPTTAPARMLAAVEAITGQLYLAVLVARLVGLHIAHSPLKKGGSSGNEQ